MGNFFTSWLLCAIQGLCLYSGLQCALQGHRVPSRHGVMKAFATSDIESKDLCNLDLYSSWEEALPYSTYSAVFGPPCCLPLPRGN